MGTVVCVKELDVPADKVWAVLSDFGGFLGWATGGNGSLRLEGTGVGAIRHLELPGLGKMAERLDRNDHDTRTQGYTLMYGQPIGMGKYSAVVTVSDSPGGCRLDWKGEFEAAPGADPADVAKALEGSYTGMSAALDIAARG